MRKIGADVHLQLLPLWCWQVQHLQKELNPFAKKTLHFEIWSRTEDAYEIEDPWIWETNGLMKWFVIVLLEQEGKPSFTINRRVPERNMLESLLLVMINLRIIKNSMATHILYYRLQIEVSETQDEEVVRERRNTCIHYDNHKVVNPSWGAAFQSKEKTVIPGLWELTYCEGNISDYAHNRVCVNLLTGLGDTREIHIKRYHKPNLKRQYVLSFVGWMVAPETKLTTNSAKLNSNMYVLRSQSAYTRANSSTNVLCSVSLSFSCLNTSTHTL